MSNSVYCSAPWNGITIREDGLVRTCCAGESVLANLHQTSIDSIESSKVLKEIQDSMLQGKPHPNCNQCVQQEKTQNLAPLRQHYQLHYPDVNQELKLKFVDVRWNNRCNLGCMYCNGTFSSTWEDRLTGTIKRPAVKEYQEELLEWILNRANHVQEIMLVGGEPMLMKQNYELIKQLPDSARISIITNLSYDFEKLPCLQNLMRRPNENIIWNVSVENTGKQFEYVRNGANWDLFEKNLRFITKIWPNAVSLNMVYSLFSALNLKETVQIYNLIGVHKITVMPVLGNNEIDVFRLPPEIKKLAIKSIEQLQRWHTGRYREDANLYSISGINDIKIGLESTNNIIPTLSQVQNKIAWYDSYNTNRFQDLWPTEFDLLNKFLV